ncbi:unnamed protein product [Closterium sp. NIES-65]|nr:unnamed protein product [Closterium sp. NIES-65]
MPSPRPVDSPPRPSAHSPLARSSRRGRVGASALPEARRAAWLAAVAVAVAVVAMVSPATAGRPNVLDNFLPPCPTLAEPTSAQPRPFLPLSPPPLSRLAPLFPSPLALPLLFLPVPISRFPSCFLPPPVSPPHPPCAPLTPSLPFSPSIAPLLESPPCQHPSLPFPGSLSSLPTPLPRPLPSPQPTRPSLHPACKKWSDLATVQEMERPGDMGKRVHPGPRRRPYKKWSDPATWAPGPIPGRGDAIGANVTIACGEAILLDTSPITLTLLNIRGFLRVLDSPALPKVDLSAAFIVVQGNFSIGTPQQHYRQRIKITLTPNPNNRADYLFTENLPAEPAFPRNLGHKAFAVVGGQVDFHGMPGGSSTPAWTKLTGTAQPNDLVITVQDDVSAWPQDAFVVVTSTDYFPDQAEVVGIIDVVALPSGGSKIFLEKPLRLMHFGDPKGVPDGYGGFVDQRAEVALLNRSIAITGTDEPAPYHREGGHFMIFMSNTPQFIEGVEFAQMGQQGKLGRYNIHFHVCGDDAGRSVVRKNVMHDSKQVRAGWWGAGEGGSKKRCVVVHTTFNLTVEENVAYHTRGHCFMVEENRCVVVHTTFNLTVEENVAYHTRGHCFMVEEGGETDNTFLRNLGIWTRAVEVLIPLSSEHMEIVFENSQKRFPSSPSTVEVLIPLSSDPTKTEETGDVPFTLAHARDLYLIPTPNHPLLPLTASPISGGAHPPVSSRPHQDGGDGRQPGHLLVHPVLALLPFISLSPNHQPINHSPLSVEVLIPLSAADPTKTEETDDAPSTFWITNPNNNFIGNTVGSINAPSTFWITNPNSFIGNVAAGSENSGYWMELRDRVRGFTLSYPGLNATVPANGPFGIYRQGDFWVDSEVNATVPANGPFGIYRDNWQWKPSTGTISGLLLYKQSGDGLFVHNSDGLIITNSTFADNRQGLNLLGNTGVKVTDSRFIGVTPNYGNPRMCDSTPQMCGPVTGCDFPLAAGQQGRSQGWSHWKNPIFGIIIDHPTFGFDFARAHAISNCRFHAYDSTCRLAAAIGAGINGAPKDTWATATSVQAVTGTPGTNMLYFPPRNFTFPVSAAAPFLPPDLARELSVRSPTHDVFDVPGGDVNRGGEATDLYTLWDKDGSLLNATAGGYLLANNTALLPPTKRFPACQPVPAWNAYACPGTCYRTVMFTYLEPGFAVYANSSVPDTRKRGDFSYLAIRRIEDDTVITVDGNLRSVGNMWTAGQRIFVVPLLANATYEVNIGLPGNNRAFFPSNITVQLRDSNGCGGPVTLRIPAKQSNQWMIKEEQDVNWKACAGTSDKAAVQFSFVCFKFKPTLELFFDGTSSKPISLRPRGTGVNMGMRREWQGAACIRACPVLRLLIFETSQNCSLVAPYPTWACDMELHAALLVLNSLCCHPSPIPPPFSTSRCGLVAPGSTWAYDVSGRELHAAVTGAMGFSSPRFNDASWPRGPAIIGYVGWRWVGINTWTPPSGDALPTFYYRRPFRVANSACATGLYVDVIVNDGVLLYLNGVEMLRVNMAPGAVNVSSRALSNQNVWDYTSFFIPLNATAPFSLAEGTNHIAAESHAAIWTTENFFDLKLSAQMDSATCSGVLILQEVCDGLDNNNDGKVDIDPLTDRLLTRPCRNPCGAGIETCIDGAFQNCTAPVHGPEVCNGVDDNCDGLIDNSPSPTAARLDCADGSLCFKGQCLPYGPLTAPVTVINKSAAGWLYYDKGYLPQSYPTWSTNSSTVVTPPTSSSGGALAPKPSRPAHIFLSLPRFLPFPSAPHSNVPAHLLKEGAAPFGFNSTSPTATNLSLAAHQWCLCLLLPLKSHSPSLPLSLAPLCPSPLRPSATLPCAPLPLSLAPLCPSPLRPSAPQQERASASREGRDSPEGAAPFGYNSASPTATNLSQLTSGDSAYFFLKSFALTEEEANNTWSYSASVQRDDGAVLLMNGAEFFRSNMPAGPITSASFAATGTWGADKTTFFNSTPFRSIAQFLQPGTNWVGVQLHQSRWSSDALFDLELTRHAMRPCSALEGSPAACVRTPPADTLLLAQGSTWAYNDASLPPPNPDTWFLPSFDDSAWLKGPAPRAPSSGQQQGGHQPHSQQHHQRLTSGTLLPPRLHCHRCYLATCHVTLILSPPPLPFPHHPGPAPLAAGNNRAGTNLTLNSTTSGSRVAHYFRRAFTVTDAACHVALTVSFNIADGAPAGHCAPYLCLAVDSHCCALCCVPLTFSLNVTDAAVSFPAHHHSHFIFPPTPHLSSCPPVPTFLPTSLHLPTFFHTCPPVVYLNGVEAYRFQMPPPSWGPVTPATNATGGYVWRWVPSVLSGGWLQQGANVIAVEVHQQRSTNTLLTFDVQVTSKREAIACTPAPQ